MANPQRPSAAAPAHLQQLTDELHAELEQAQKELKEIDLLIQQTSAEVDRLAQRNAQTASYLKQLEAHLDTVPRADLQSAYTAALEAQKRLLMMRGQLEKLQSDQQNIGHYVSNVRSVYETLQQIPGGAGPVLPAMDGDNSGQPFIVRIIEAQEQERQRLVRQLHDGPAQSLTNLILQAEICERVFDSDAKRARTELGELKTAVTSTFQKVRDYMFDLRR